MAMLLFVLDSLLALPTDADLYHAPRLNNNDPLPSNILLPKIPLREKLPFFNKIKHLYHVS